MTPAAESQNQPPEAGELRNPKRKAKTATEDAQQAPAGAAGDASGAGLHARRIAYTALAVAVISFAVAGASMVRSAKPMGDAVDHPLLLLGVAQLRPALMGSQPFHLELATLYKVVPAKGEIRKALDEIAPAADEGIPTFDQLRRRFHWVARDVLIHEAAPPGEPLVDRMLVFVESVVPILAGKNAALSIIRVAEGRLFAGDLAGAVAEVEKLTGRPAEISQRWMESARHRLAATAALKKLESVASLPRTTVVR